jgi:hypothetical protein
MAFSWYSRMQVPRMTVRRLIAIVAISTAPMLLVRTVLRSFEYERASAAPSLKMSELCQWEGEFMAVQANRCRQRAKGGLPWDEDSEFVSMLKVCPFLGDFRRGESWAAQAEVWERASGRSLKAAEKRRRRED